MNHEDQNVMPNFLDYNNEVFAGDIRYACTPEIQNKIDRNCYREVRDEMDLRSFASGGAGDDLRLYMHDLTRLILEEYK